MRKTVDLVNQRAGAEDVIEAIHALMHLYRGGQFRGGRAGAAPLTPMEGRALGFFARRPGATLSELVAHSGRDKGQLARLVGGLRERGLLEAQADEADRRNVRLRLTAAGEKLDQSMRRRGRRLAAVAVEGLTEAERTKLLALLGRMRANLEGGAGD